MWKYPNEQEQELLDKLSKNSKIAGVIFILLGVVGIIYPVIMTMLTVTFISWLLLVAGIMAGYFTYMSDKSDSSGWLKSVILIGVALFMLFYPISGAGTVGMLLSIYFFMDAFASFSMGLSMKGAKGWLIWIFNAITSLLLAVVFIIGWPTTSMYLIGIFIGFSLFFDGVSLLIVGRLFKKH